MAISYEWTPEEQREYALAKLFKYIKDYIHPYHPYYRKIFKENKINADKLNSYDDLRRIPVTTREDVLADQKAFILQPRLEDTTYDVEKLKKSKELHYLYRTLNTRYMRDVYGKPRSFTERVRQTGAAEWNPILFLLSGGTTGMPILAAYTTYEIDNIIPHIAGMMYVFGWEPGMRALNMFPALPRLAFFQLLFSGLKVDQGAGIFHTCGEEAVPTEMQVAIAVQMPFDAYFAVPSLMADWLEKAVGMIDGGMPKPAPVKFAAVGAEPLSDEHREKLKSQFEKIGSPDVKIVEGYGCAELKAAFFECDQNSGLHLNPEFYFWEVLDPETEEPVEWGRPGVLCFSHVGWRGSVFLRYRTGDIAGGGVAWKRCGKCGLTLPLMMSPISRATSGPST